MRLSDGRNRKKEFEDFDTASIRADGDYVREVLRSLSYFGSVEVAYGLGKLRGGGSVTRPWSKIIDSEALCEVDSGAFWGTTGLEAHRKAGHRHGRKILNWTIISAEASKSRALPAKS